MHDFRKAREHTVVARWIKLPGREVQRAAI